MKKYAIYLSIFLSSTCFAENGSLMTDLEEATALTNDTKTCGLISSAAAEFMDSLSQYRNSQISYDALSTSYQSIYTKLNSDIAQAIDSDPTSKIKPIENDYDQDHQSEYQAHLQELIGLSQRILNIPAYKCILPPTPNEKNLLVNGDFSQDLDGWTLSGGSATLVVNPAGTLDDTSPVANKNSLSFKDMPDKPGYASVSQTIPTTPKHIYLISGYVLGTAPSGDGAYSGGINATSVRFLTSSITGKTTHFPQNSNEIDEANWHRRYYTVIADGSSMTLSLSGGAKSAFKSISVIDITSNQTPLMQNAALICPTPVTTGDQDVGHYPQVEQALSSTDNLLDGGVSMQKNIDQSALKNAGHPYWYIDGSVSANHGIKFVNGLNGAHAIVMPSSATITTSGPVPCPIGAYTLTVDVLVPEGASGKLNMQFSGTNLINNASLPKITQDFDSLTPGQWNTVTLNIDSQEFSEMAAGTFFRPTAIFTATGGDITLANAKLLPSDANVWSLINGVNPYDSSRSWYQEKGASNSYDFSKSPISHDWGVALTGNTMFAPGAPASDFTMQVEDGVKLRSTYNKDTSPPYANGGIQSTQMIPSGQSFSISMSFTANSDGSGYEPTVALWTYGESQRGPESPIYHTNAPGADPITEFDCEMGSDSAPNTPPPSGKVCIRDGSYIGHAFGGHSEYIDMNSDGTENWKEVPDFWDGKPHTLVMKGDYNQDGRFTLTRLLDGRPFSTQDLGFGPFSPMYIKIALENPNWNSRGHINGSAEIVVHSVDVNVMPKKTPQGGVIPTVAIDDIDYTWFTPGGGGAISYCPFPN